MNDAKTKQQVVDKIQSSTNILVTVSDSPSVDALSAALGLTLMLDGLGKHATSIFSGSIPPAITFLDPEKTFEATIDSLRDFIIALDKEKADHLRYKIDGDMVKIFITPYRTTITDKDLEFSQGDYNVELILALGVDNQDHLDKALASHGQILHDATVVTISAGEQVSQLGSIDWHDPQASSLSEMLASLTDLIKVEGEGKTLLNQQSATALLTGIVAATERFSNTKTSSKVMNIAAQLMAAGADQQLIASKLQASSGVTSQSADNMQDDSSANAYGVTDAGGINIEHNNETLEQLDERVRADDVSAPLETTEAKVEPTAISEPEVPAVSSDINSAYALGPEDEVQGSTPAVVDTAIISEPAPVASITEPTPAIVASQPKPATTGEPIVQGHNYSEDDSSSLQDDALLKHAYLTDMPENTAPINSTEVASKDEPSVDIFSGNQPPQANDPTTELNGAIAPMTPEFAASLPQPPPLPDFSKLPPPTSLGGSSMSPGLPPQTPEILGDILKDDQPVIPAMPSMAPPSITPLAPSVPPAPTANPSDPGQFQIPGQV